MKYVLKLWVLVCLGILQANFSLSHAQVLYGSIVGQVEDPSGAAIPSATVIITNSATGQKREAVTDAAGRFSVTNVLAGTYDVSVQAQGFRTLQRKDVSVTINTVNRLNLKLEVGQVSEQITVESTAAVLQTDKADTHTEITSKPISALPLNQYRNYQALINLVPGATPAGFQNSPTDSPQRSLATNVNGTNKNNNSTRLDGATNVFIWLPHHNVYVAPSETVETVNVSTSSFDAEQGMAGGAAVTVVTKSGTNDLHGSLFEFHDNQHLKARNFFQKPGTEKSLGISNIMGATLGGRIIKNKLFYFGGWEGTYQREGGTGLYTVPTAEMRAGNFSGGNRTIYNPFTGVQDPNDPNYGRDRQAFANNQIPNSMVSPIAQKIQSLIPLPNLPGVQNNYSANGVQKFDRNQGDIKINWNRNEKNMIWGKYSMMDATVGSPFVFGEIGGPAVVGNPATGHTRVYVGTVGTTYTFSPTVFFDGNVGYTRMDQTVQGADFGTNYGTDVFGIPGTNGPDIRQSGLPIFAISGFTSLGQTGGWIPAQRNDHSWTNTNNLTWIRGAHQLRFGFDMVHHSLNHWQPEQGNGPRGGFTFNGGPTALGGGAAPNLYNAYAAFLLGLPSSSNKSLQNILLTGREWQFGWYAQDRWQISRSLTLNIGLRYEYYPLMTRKDSGIERLDPFTNTLYMGGRGNVPTNAGISVSKTLFAPRIGIAYRLDEKTVIRSGYGLSYDPLPVSRPLRGWYPYTISKTFEGPNSLSYYDLLSNGIPPIVGPDISSGITNIPAGVEERSPWGKINRGYIQSWNFTVERKLPGDFITSVGYVGTQTTNQFADRALNYSDPGKGQAGRQLYHLYGNATIDMWDGYLSSNYHSLQVAINRQFTHGLFIKGAYTWAKAINMTDEDGWADLTFLHPSQFGRNRAPAGYDRRHVFQIAGIYELPFGKGKPWAQSGVSAALLGGWQINTLFYAYTGTPFNITSPGTSLNAPGTGTQMADLVKQNVKHIGGVGPGQKWFDTTAFAPVTAVRFGNFGRNVMRGPGVIGADLSLFRSFNFTEKYRLEFRAESFNFTNTPRFGNPNGDSNSPNFGVITSASGDRQFRFGLKFAF